MTQKYCKRRFFCPILESKLEIGLLLLFSLTFLYFDKVQDVASFVLYVYFFKKVYGNVVFHDFMSNLFWKECGKQWVVSRYQEVGGEGAVISLAQRWGKGKQ